MIRETIFANLGLALAQILALIKVARLEEQIYIYQARRSAQVRFLSINNHDVLRMKNAANIIFLYECSKKVTFRHLLS